MNDEGYRDMVIDHDKHIDSLTQSVSALADNVLGTNSKLDNVIEVLQHQNVLQEKLFNLDKHTTESFERTFDRIEANEIQIATFIPKSTIMWFMVIIITYSVSFGVFTTNNIHGLDKLTSEKIQMQEQKNKNVEFRLNNIEKGK